jgi:hypothetical protein
MKTELQEGLIAAPRDKRDLWDQFRDDRELMARLRITPNEIDTLAHCALLGTLTCKQDLLFILRQIREATRPITAEELVELRPVPQLENLFEEPVLPMLRTHPIAPAALKPTKAGSFEALVRGHSAEQVGISVGVLVLVGSVMWYFAIAIYRWREQLMAGVSAPPSLRSVSWLARLDDFIVLLGWEVLFVGCILAAVVLRSRRRHRRLKVRPI